MPSIAALDWKADALIDLDEAETETDDPDWDDVAILIGSEIVRDVRAMVRDKLKYTCVSKPIRPEFPSIPFLPDDSLYRIDA